MHPGLELIDRIKTGESGDPHVSIVIINYNGLKFLRDCLESLPGIFGHWSCEVIVVDNASTDGSTEYLRARSDIRLIESTVNSGFCGGNNQGVCSARGKFVLLLNNDTVCLSALAPLLECMADESCGVAGCTLYYADGRLQPSVGYDHTPIRVVLSWLGLGALGLSINAASRVERDIDYYRQKHGQVDWVSGACMLTRRDLWGRLGGFDESFFMYCEDVDYCRRVRAAGYNVSYTPEADIRHYEGGGAAWVGRMALLRTVRSYLLFMRKHFGCMAQLFVATSLGAVLLVRSLTYQVIARSKPCDDVVKEKRGAYLEAARYLLTHALARDALGKTI